LLQTTRLFRLGSSITIKMSLYTNQILADQIRHLSEKLEGPFPYEDCDKVLAQLREKLGPKIAKCYQDLIPDLDAYFYLVASHSSGVEFVVEWQTSELVGSQLLLKKSFYQTHTRYREIEWMINEINTPKLHMRLTVCDELRVMLQKLMLDLVEEMKRVNTARQQEFLLA